MFLFVFTVALFAAANASLDDLEDWDNVENRARVIKQYDENNFTVAVRPNSKGSKAKSFCCVWAKKYCIVPCIGQKCTSQCTVRCGFMGKYTCSPISCQVANPILCTAATTTVTSTTSTTVTTVTTVSTTSTTTLSTNCDGWTQVGSKCYKVEAGPSNYYDAIAGCIAIGGKLATIESQAEQDAIFALTGATGAYIGLSDFLDEGVFAWVDGTAVSFTNWRPNQPNNANSNQHCVWIRPDAGWDDVTCKKTEQYVCQKSA